MSKQHKKQMDKQYWKGYYEAMYGGLKHNILLMLSQMEGNLEHSKFNAIPYLEFIESRIKEIKEKVYGSQTNRTVQQGRGDVLSKGSTIADESGKAKTEDTQKGCGRMYCAIIDEDTGQVCGRVDESYTAHCIKHSRSTHNLCGENGLCNECRESTISVPTAEVTDAKIVTEDVFIEDAFGKQSKDEQTVGVKKVIEKLVEYLDENVKGFDGADFWESTLEKDDKESKGVSKGCGKYETRGAYTFTCGESTRDGKIQLCKECKVLALPAPEKE